jgi:hypothetical protein
MKRKHWIMTSAANNAANYTSNSVNYPNGRFYRRLFAYAWLAPEKAANGDFRNWLNTSTYVPKSNESTLILGRTDWDKFLPFIAFDINRLTTAARETLQSISAVHNAPKSISWSLVEACYAAFYYSQFAANA